tara:strand:+ start:352 stop:666 length:315 start_codon:yes stop_codon:yes gene_type:complete
VAGHGVIGKWYKNLTNGKRGNMALEKAVITIHEETKLLDFWVDEIHQFVNFKHELLEEYIKKYPEVKEKFLKRKKVNEVRIAPSNYTPCTIECAYPNRKGFPKI